MTDPENFAHTAIRAQEPELPAGLWPPGWVGDVAYDVAARSYHALAGPAEVNEAAGTITYTVTLSNASASAVTVDYASVNGSATAGSDYTAASDTVAFTAGETTETISIPILNDGVLESDETFVVNLSNALNATIGEPQGQATIEDNDASISIGDVTVNVLVRKLVDNKEQIIRSVVLEEVHGAAEFLEYGEQAHIVFDKDTEQHSVKHLTDASRDSSSPAGVVLESIRQGFQARLAHGGCVDQDGIRALDQEARGALRRLGVRFGAFHVFIPALIKPAPAALLTLLWALANEGKDKPGFGDVVAALAAGRTSTPLDESFDKAFYRLAGFRVVGKRAVRVDILERLADLIRPALAWKPGQGARPDGAYDGNAFIVTPGMMSILGATPQDMVEVLKALGYRGLEMQAEEVAAKLAELDRAQVPEPAGTETSAAVEGQVGVSGNGAVESETVAAPEGTPDGQAETAGTPAEETVAQVQEPVPTGAAPTEAAAPEDAPAVAVAEGGAVEDEEPKTIMIWRPGRFDGGRGRDRQRGRRQGDGTRADGRDDRRPGSKQGKPGGKKGRAKGPRFDGAPPRPQREQRKVEIDPDSPFAKLAALKEQLKS